MSLEKEFRRNESGDRGCFLALFKTLILEERVDINDCYINSDEWLHNYLEHILCISFYEAKVSTGQWNL